MVEEGCRPELADLGLNPYPVFKDCPAWLNGKTCYCSCHYEYYGWSHSSTHVCYTYGVLSGRTSKDQKNPEKKND